MLFAESSATVAVAEADIRGESIIALPPNSPIDPIPFGTAKYMVDELYATF